MAIHAAAAAAACVIPVLLGFISGSLHHQGPLHVALEALTVLDLTPLLRAALSTRTGGLGGRRAAGAPFGGC
jgi:hypothetical protein